MKLPAIRACIGDWVYYVATMTFKDVAENVKKVDNELHKSELLKELLQRSITSNYKNIAQYIQSQQERFFNALVLAVYDGDPLWHEVRLEYDDGTEFYNLGVLELSKDEKIFPVDGQHRVEGIKEAVKNNDAYNEEEVPVIFISHKTDDYGMQRSRRLFSTLNRYAKPVSMRDIIALDEDDIVAIVSRDLIDRHPLFTNERLLDAKTKSIPETNEKAFTTIITFYQCNYELLWLLVKDMTVYNAEGQKAKGKSKLKEFIRRRPSDQIIEQFNALCNDFWNSLSRTYTDFEQYLSNSPDSTLYRNRNGGNVLFRPIALLPFVRATVKYASAHDVTFETVFSRFPHRLLLLDNVIWRNVMWNKEKKTMIVNNQALTERIILYYLDSNLLSEKELSTMKLDLKSIREIETMDDVEELLRMAIEN